MATKNLIPRGSGEGGIGITGAPWGSGVFNSGIFNESLTVGGEQVALSSNLSSYATTADLSNYATTSDISDSINYAGLTGHIIPDTNAAYDLGNAEYKIRHLFLSDNSLHIGGTTISAGDTLGDIQFPSGITVTKDSYFNNKVGIGSTSPSHPLTILSPTTPGTTTRCVKMYRGAGDLNQSLEMGYNGITVNRDDATMANPQSTFAIKQKGSDAERTVIHIDTAGNVGIGTTSPTANHKLHIKNTETANFRLERNKTAQTNTQNGYVQIAAAQGENIIYSKDLDGNDKDFVIDASNVGIGVDGGNKAFLLNAGGAADEPTFNIHNKSAGDAVKISPSGIEFSGIFMAPDENERITFGESGIMVGQAEVRPDPDNPESIYFQAIPQVKDSEGNAVTVLTADKLGLGTTAVLENAEQDLQFKLLTDQQRFVVGTTGDYGLESGWYRFNDFKVKGATDIGANSINPVDTRIYSDESSFILFKTDTAGNRVAHLVGGDEEVSANNAIALGIAVKVDSLESPEDIEFVHTDGESYSVINGNSDSIGANGLPIRQGFQSPSLGSAPAPLLIDGGSF